MPAELSMLLFTGLLAAGSVTAPAEVIDLEMLEFIGAFETQGGHALDPLSLEDPEPEKLQPEHAEKKYD